MCNLQMNSGNPHKFPSELFILFFVYPQEWYKYRIQQLKVRDHGHPFFGAHQIWPGQVRIIVGWLSHGVAGLFPEKKKARFKGTQFIKMVITCNVKHWSKWINIDQHWTYESENVITCDHMSSHVMTSLQSLVTPSFTCPIHRCHPRQRNTPLLPNVSGLRLCSDLPYSTTPAEGKSPMNSVE